MTNDTWITFKDGNNIYYVPEYIDEPIYNFNKAPYFEEFILEEKPYEEYAPLDSLGRCTLTSAICCKGTMPKPGEVRGSISNVTPTGWKQAKYDIISGKYLYNRCHLIGWQLTAENANKKNLITGTKYLNIDGMLPIENSVAKHIKETEHYVAYQVTPIYDGQGLLPLGVHMEVDCISCDDNGTTYNVFCYNVQPGIELDYVTGGSKLC
jgi:DNA-entry nuclease